MTAITAETATAITREGWLRDAVLALAPLFESIDAPLPPVRVSVGWPGGRGKKNNVIGQCWSTSTASDGVSNLFISPVLDDSVRVLDVLVHELVHAVDDCKSGHKGAFRKMATALGLEGPMTATHAGDDLRATLAKIADDLGEYPHAAMVTTSGAGKQTTRMLKVECAEGSGYIVRMTRKWLDEFGAPSCPCHGEQMLEA